MEVIIDVYSCNIFKVYIAMIYVYTVEGFPPSS